MPITPFLGDATFDPETKRVMGVAFEMVCTALRLVDRDDLANQMIAKRIIELANAGERNRRTRGQVSALLTSLNAGAFSRT
jgi:hypothetical protein